MAKIIITINKKGETQIHVVEAQGKKCLEITDKLEEKLGQVVERELTSEYYQQPENAGTIFQTNIYKNRG